MRPNVLLVILDAARRDALEPYGASPGSSPTVADLAKGGRALPQVYATGSWTVPSHASIFTGLMPRAAGLSRVPSLTAPKPVLDAQRERVLPEVMRQAGYRTAAVSANLWVSEASGFDLGFEEFVQINSGRQAHFHGSGFRSRLGWLSETARASIDDGARAAGDTFARWIDAPPDQPFFWFANIIESHSPYLPPRPYGDVSLLERLRAGQDALRYYTLPAIWRSCTGGYDVPDSTIERMRRLYRASIRYMDDWLGRLLERMDQARLLDDTLVIVASDHGENFGEGGLLTHALSLDNRLIHVPVVLAGPGSDGASITSLAELPRLIADAAGLDRHPWHDDLPAGIGVAQFDPPAEPDDPKVREAVTEWGLGDEAARKLTTPLTCAVQDELKLVENGDREEVYDLATDPLELAAMTPADTSPDRAGQLAALRAAVRHPAVTAERSADAPAAAPDASPEELRDIEERMKLLGYM